MQPGGCIFEGMSMLVSEPIFEQDSSRPMSHCSTLTILPDGALLAAWFSGSYETSPDVAILASRRESAAAGWSAPAAIAEVPGYSLGQPVYLVRPDGELWLFFDVITGKDWTSAQPYLQKSPDNGLTWQPAVQLMDYPGLMFRSKPVILADRIIMPVYDENTWQSMMMISEDGLSWRLTDPMATPQGNIHPTVVQMPGDSLLAYLRTGGHGGVIWRTESTDGGDTWCIPTPTDLLNPNSGIDLIRLKNGSLVLAYNPSDRLRTPLRVALSEQDEQWRWQQDVDDTHAEVSYPALQQTADGLIHLVYTYRRERIQYACFDEQWLREGDR
jgi:predicted neuraminidase